MLDKDKDGVTFIFVPNVNKKDRENLVKTFLLERQATLGRKRSRLKAQPDSLNIVDDNSSISHTVASEDPTGRRKSSA